MSSVAPITVLPWSGGPEFAELLAAYVLVTEREKGSQALTVADLPERLRTYLAAPGEYHQRDHVLVAYQGECAVGCVIVLEPADGMVEIKRLYVDPHARRTGAGRALLRAALAAAERGGASAARLSVWHWRADARALYLSEGFAEVVSWEEREGLVCMARTL